MYAVRRSELKLKANLSNRFLAVALALLLLVIPSISLSEWVEVGTSYNNNIVYLDFDRIRQHEGHVYFWTLVNYLEPGSDGDFSSTSYYKADCGKWAIVLLKLSTFKQHDGIGEIAFDLSFTKQMQTWIYPEKNTNTDSFTDLLLTHICDFSASMK